LFADYPIDRELIPMDEKIMIIPNNRPFIV